MCDPSLVNLLKMWRRYTCYSQSRNENPAAHPIPPSPPLPPPPPSAGSIVAALFCWLDYFLYSPCMQPCYRGTVLRANSVSKKVEVWSVSRVNIRMQPWIIFGSGPKLCYVTVHFFLIFEFRSFKPLNYASSFFIMFSIFTLCFRTIKYCLFATGLCCDIVCTGFFTMFESCSFKPLNYVFNKW